MPMPEMVMPVPEVVMPMPELAMPMPEVAMPEPLGGEGQRHRRGVLQVGHHHSRDTGQAHTSNTSGSCCIKVKRVGGGGGGSLD
jgi:hypothetical protein